MDQRGTDTRNLVGADRRPDPATTNGDTAVHRPGRHRLGERDDEVRIVVVRAHLVGAEIDDLVPGGLKLLEQVLFQAEAAVVGGDSYAHDGDLRSVVSASGGRGSRR